MHTKRRVLQIIAEQLLAPGGCPVDSSCPYASAIGCTAKGKVLEEKVSQARRERQRLLEEGFGGGIVMPLQSRNPESDTWPCDMFLTFAFASEDEYNE